MLGGVAMDWRLRLGEGEGFLICGMDETGLDSSSGRESGRVRKEGERV